MLVTLRIPVRSVLFYSAGMRPAHIVDIVTPKKVVLQGLLFGPTRPRRVLIWVHGLMSSAFSKGAIIDRLVDAETAVLAFNNRGFEIVSGYRQIKNRAGEYRWKTGGCAHEVFTDCVDDIDGAIACARSLGAAEIVLIGHSTGCQKSVYWASARASRNPDVRGIVLLAPLSDRAGALKELGTKRLSKLLKEARQLVRRGKGHTLMPEVSGISADAQRFVSLYAADSRENVFPYDDEKAKATRLRSVRLPILVLWAGADEYSDRDTQKIVQWFQKVMQNKDFSQDIVPDVGHSFRGGEEYVAREIRQYIDAL